MSPLLSVSAADGTGLVAGRSGRRGAPRVVLLHSLALDRSLWRRVEPLLAADFDLLALDCRGHGASERVAGPYTVELMADDVRRVLDAVGWEDAVVAGCSMGGCVAQAFAVAEPERVRGLVLVDTTAWYGPTAAESWGARARKAREQGMSSMLDFQEERWFSAAFRTAERELVADLRERFAANPVGCFEATCGMLASADLRGRIDGFGGPAAVLVGEDDGATPPAMADDLAARLGLDGPRVLPTGRHLTPLELPTEVAQAVGVVVAAAHDGGVTRA